MAIHPIKRGLRRVTSRLMVAGFAALCGLSGLSLSAMAQTTRLQSHVPQLVANSVYVGNVSDNTPISLAVALPLRNEQQLNTFLTNLYTPGNPQYGQYLTPAQFTAYYGPTQADYNALISYFQSQGFTVTQQHSNRLVLDVQASAKTVQAAFNLHLNKYQDPTGRVFFAPDANPTVPTNLASTIQTIVGLDNAVVRTNSITHRSTNPMAFLTRPPKGVPLYGNGPAGGLSPADIKKVYNITGTQDGSGQVLGLLEYDGYNWDPLDTVYMYPTDVRVYENYFGIYTGSGFRRTYPTIVPVLIDGFANTAGGGAVEVTLDIEMMLALAPKAKLLVYECDGTGHSSIDMFSRVAEDNYAKSISISWGSAEAYTGGSGLTAGGEALAENGILKQYAAQGQSFYASSGDSGAWGDGFATGGVLSVNDPASQPYATAVGGTRLSFNADGSWKNETTWAWGRAQSGYYTDSGLVWNFGNPADLNYPFEPVGGGGGISILWTIPSYQAQAGVVTTASQASTIYRNVPDVSLNSDPNTGYSIAFYQGLDDNSNPIYWETVGGTSCAAPLWAAYTGLVNQQRVANGLPTLGFANPAIYSIGLNATKYAADFHDIADNSNNLYKYTAVKGYDLCTGWGSFNGAKLLTDLVAYGTPPPPPPPATQLIGNPGFEQTSSNPRPWFATANVISAATTAEPANGGKWIAWLGGTSKAHSDLLTQQVTIPSTVTKATLTFYLHIDTNKPTVTAAHDALVASINSNGNGVLQTLGTFTNLNAAPGYVLQTYDLSAYKGQTIQIALNAKQDGTMITSFVVDDFALNVQ